MAGEAAGRILVVEDDAGRARSVTAGLLDEGYAVVHAADGSEAAQALREGAWDLVILDWRPPGGDGLALLVGHRREGRDTPVLLLSDGGAVGDRVAGLDAGADDCLCKPFAFDELLARVRALVRSRRAAEEMTLWFSDVRVDVVSRRASRAGRPLDLTTKELGLLVVFLKHKGEILSRARLYAQVWGEGRDLVSNTLEVHVKELRPKLESPGSRVVHTVRGRGYMLGDPPADGRP